MVSTSYTKSSINSENYLKSVVTSAVILLETGGKILLEDGGAILQELLVDNSVNFAKGTINSTNYSKPT